MFEFESIVLCTSRIWNLTGQGKLHSVSGSELGAGWFVYYTTYKNLRINFFHFLHREVTALLHLTFYNHYQDWISIELPKLILFVFFYWILFVSWSKKCFERIWKETVHEALFMKAVLDLKLGVEGESVGVRTLV